MTRRTRRTLTAALTAVGAGIACGAFAGESVEWNVDPYSWARDGESFVSHGGFRDTAGCVAEAKGPHCTHVRIRANVKVEKPGELLWGGVGLAVRDNFEELWTLTLDQAAKGAGSHHYVEMSERCARAEGEQRALRKVGPQTKLAWTNGVDYVLELSVTPERVRGTVSLPGAEKPLFESEYAFDGKPAVTRGKPALFVFGDFRGRVSNVSVERSGEVEATPVPAVPYASDQYIRGISSRATGYFRSEKIDGRWTLIDPLGRGYMGLGVGLVNRYIGHCEKLGYSEYGRYVEKAFPKPDAWEADTVAKLKKWGFSTFGNLVQRSLLRRGLSMSLNLYMGRHLSMADDEWCLTPYRGMATTGFPNVFHPKFAEACDFLAGDFCTRYRNDPWLLGYYIDNEPDWRGGHDAKAYRYALSLFDQAMAKPDGSSAKRAVVEFLAGRKVTNEIRHEFLRIVAEKYFSTFCAAIRKHDPNHLIVGCRFPGCDSACTEVWETAAKYCDVITFNLYPWLDLETGTLAYGRGGRNFKDWYESMYARCGKPFYITEWSFCAYDSGLPNRFGAGEVFDRQFQRTCAAEHLLRMLVSSPCFVGHDYFCWLDQPALGWHATDPENANFGLVNKDGVPYEGLVGMFGKIQNNLAEWRDRPLPEPKVSFARDGDKWSLSNAFGLKLEGTVGDSLMVRDVTLNGYRYGSYNGFVLMEDDRDVWAVAEVTKVRDLDFKMKDGTGILTLAAEGGLEDGRKFRVVHQLQVPPYGPDFRPFILGVSNVGEKPFTAYRLVMREIPADLEAKAVTGPKRNMDPWESNDTMIWQFADGHRFGMASTYTPNAFFKNYFPAKKQVGSDLAFVIPGTKRLEPGEKWKPARPFGAKTIIE